MGLSAEQGSALALATFTGAAQLAAQSIESVALLRERVTSKGALRMRRFMVVWWFGGLVLDFLL